MPIVDLPDAETRFATPAELATYLQRDLDKFETATAELLLALASAAIRTYTGRTLSAVVNDTVVLDGTYSTLLRLPDYPVTALTSITVGGVVVPPTDYRLYADAGIVRRTAGWGWGWSYGSVTVVYSHGYAADSPEMALFKSICLELAARPMHVATVAGVSSEQIGSYQVTYDTVEREFADVVGDRLSPYRTMVVA